jgi:hypothetical protein
MGRPYGTQKDFYGAAVLLKFSMKILKAQQPRKILRKSRRDGPFKNGDYLDAAT